MWHTAKPSTKICERSERIEIFNNVDLDNFYKLNIFVLIAYDNRAFSIKDFNNFKNSLRIPFFFFNQREWSLIK